MLPISSFLALATLAAPEKAAELPAVRGVVDAPSHLFGDALGSRPWLESRGIQLEAVYLVDWSKNLRGGVSTNGSNVGGLFDVMLTLDTGAFGLWPNGTLLANFICQSGDFATVDVGDLQVVDNADADGRVELYELWYEHQFFDGAARIKLGKIDVNSDFDATEFTDEFIHSSPGFSPTILGLPTYPDPAVGAQIFVEPTDWFYLGLGIFDGATQEGYNTGLRGPSTLFGAPADLFLIAESGIRWKASTNSLPGRAAIGLWQHTGSFDRFNGGTDHGTCGVYALAEQSLWRDEDRELGAFLQYGWADPKVSAIEHHIGGGIALAGPLAERPDDSLGLMISAARLSSESGAGFDDDFESAIELYYKCQITPWLSIQPDLQYIINPGGVAENDDAIVLIVRLAADL